MGELTLTEKFKHFIANLGWRVYLWGMGYSQDQYFAIMDQSYENNGWVRPLNIR